MAYVRRFDHIGITVADLDAVTAFFVGLGLEVEGRTFVEGEFLDTVIGIPNSGWSGASGSTRAPGRWHTSGGRKGSSSHSRSASAECRDAGHQRWTLLVCSRRRWPGT